MSTTTANQARAEALKAARAMDSELKRRRALAALEALKAPGITVELWDQISTADARKLGAATADALIEYFSR